MKNLTINILAMKNLTKSFMSNKILTESTNEFKKRASSNVVKTFAQSFLKQNMFKLNYCQILIDNVQNNNTLQKQDF